MQAEIYYFSGTGNSLFIARELAARLNARLTAISAVMAEGEIAPVAKVLGIVFPVYYGDLPVIVKSFAGKLANLSGKYIFSICCFGGAAGWSLRNLKKILEARGGRLSAGYGIHMPQNAFRKHWENCGKIHESCAKRLALAAKCTRGRRRGMFVENAALELLMLPVYFLLRQAVRKKLVGLSGASEDAHTDALINMAGKSFRANSTCSGCGICTAICPVGNIRMKDGLPVWGDCCQNCLACYNWCPNKAIRGGPAENGHFYRHPQIELKDMIGLSKRSEAAPLFLIRSKKIDL